MIIYNFFKTLFLYIKYYRILLNVYKDEHLIQKLEYTFKTKFHIDWVGRIYTVLNPNIIDNKFDTNNQIYEYGENGLTNNVYIEAWIMSQLNILVNFIQTNNLFDLLSYDIKKLDDFDNYLFIIKPIPFDELVKWSKWFIFLIITLTIIITFLIL